MELYDLKLEKSTTINERVNIFSETDKETYLVDNVSRWKSIRSLTNDEDFRNFLNVSGTSLEEFNYAIKELDNTDTLTVRNYIEDTDWYKLFIEVLQEYQTIEKITDRELLDIGYIIHPFLLYFQKKIQNLVNGISKFSITETVIKKIITNHAQVISDIYNKVIIIDLNIYLQSAGEEKKEFADYVEERFSHCDDLIEFYSKYAVCTRLAVIKTKHMLDFLTESFLRLEANVSEFNHVFNLKIQNDQLTDISLSIGDSHQQGRSVIIFSFNQDKVVYKPRNLKIADAYYQFIKWINTQNQLLEMKTIKGIYQEDFSFQEYVSHDECSSLEEIEDYYTRFGYNIALAYILCANDFHMENLIANGPHPILIDLETIVQSDRQIEYPDAADAEVQKQFLDTSVLNSALLPTVAFTNIENQGIDIGALSGKSEKLPYKILAPINVNQIDMKYENVEYVRPGANNLPLLNGETIDFYNYRDHILAGFKQMLGFFKDKKKELLSSDSILSVFKDKVTRTIVKNTDAYATMIGYSNHPNYCEDMIKKEKLLENMWSYPHKRKEIVLYEIEDMLDNDIPIFLSNTSSLDLFSSKHKCIKNYFQDTGYNKMLNMFKTLDDDAITKQLSVIKVSLGIYDEQVSRMKANTTDFYQVCPTTDSKLLQEARRIGNRILQDSYINSAKNELSWVNINLSNKNWTVNAMNESLYEGKAGVGLYLFELYKVTKDPLFYEGYKKAINATLLSTKYSTNYSAYNGKLSIIFPILNEIKFIGESEYKDHLVTYFKELKKDLITIAEVDWLNGLAGLLGLTVTAYTVLNDHFYLNLAKDIAGSLLIKQQQLKNELKEGFAHGCLGMAYALIRLYEQTSIELYKQKAYELIRHEKVLLGNCEDQYKWCWGSIGVGLALLDIYKVTNDDFIKASITDITAEFPNEWKNDDCICHGNLADILFFSQLQKSGLNEDVAEHEFLIRLASVMSRKEEQKDFSISQLDGLPNYTLFTGLSGVGYGMLRLLKRPLEISDVYTLKV